MLAEPQLPALSCCFCTSIPAVENQSSKSTLQHAAAKVSTTATGRDIGILSAQMPVASGHNHLAVA